MAATEPARRIRRPKPRPSTALPFQDPSFLESCWQCCDLQTLFALNTLSATDAPYFRRFLIQGLCDCVSSPHTGPFAQCGALRVLPKLAPEGDELTLKTIIDCVRTTDFLPVRCGALAALAGITTAGNPQACELLLHWLGEHNVAIRRHALEALVLIVERTNVGADDATLVAAVGQVADAVASLVKHEEETSVRTVAVSSLPRVAPRGDPGAIQIIADCLADPNRQIRYAAVGALAQLTNGRVGSPRKAAIQHLSNEKPDIRCTALMALGELAATSATARLLSRLPSPRGEEDSAAGGSAASHAGFAVVDSPAGGLADADNDRGEDGNDASASEVVDLVLACVTDKVPAVRRAAVQVLTLVAREGLPIAISAVAARLGDSDSEVQDAASRALPKIAMRGNELAIAEVMSRLDDTLSDNRTRAVLALSQVAVPGDKAATQAALSRLSDRIQSVREAAVTALLTLAGRGHSSTVATLLRGLEHASAAVRSNSVHGLAQLGREGDSAVATAVVRRLEDKDNKVRTAAATALVQISGDGTPEFQSALVQDIAARLKHQDEAVHRGVVNTLAKIAGTGCAAAMSAVVMELGEGWGDVLYKAVQKLPHLYSRGDSSAIAAVVACMSHSSTPVRAVAAQILTALAAEGDKVAVDGLIQQMGDRKAEVRCCAIMALADIATRGDPNVCAAILARLGDGNSTVRCTALTVLPQVFKRGHMTALMALSQRLKDTSGEVRVTAVRSLVSLAERGDPDVVLALRQVIDDTDTFVQNAAAFALSTIEGPHPLAVGAFDDGSPRSPTSPGGVSRSSTSVASPTSSVSLSRVQSKAKFSEANATFSESVSRRSSCKW